MKKGIVWLLLGVMLAIGGIVLFKPNLTEDWVPGLWANHHKKILRERSMELLRCLCRDDMDGCIRLTDPAFVRQNGAEQVKIRFKLMSVVVTLGRIQESDVRVEQVILGPGNKTAEVPTSIRIKDEWKVQKPSKWVRSDGQWYVSF